MKQVVKDILRVSKELLLSAIFIVAATFVAHSQDVKIQGTVRNQDGKPVAMLMMVQMVDPTDPTMGQREVSRTTRAGEFQGTFDISQPVSLIGGDGYDATRMLTDARDQDITLTESDMMQRVIDNVQVVIQGVTIPKKTTIKIVGDHMVIPMGVIIEHAWFNDNRRIMLVPLIKDLLAEPGQDSLFYLEPRVLDGSEYRMVDNRKYNFEVESNPLTEYSHILQHSDSVGLTKKQVEAKKQKAEAAKAKEAAAIARAEELQYRKDHAEEIKAEIEAKAAAEAQKKKDEAEAKKAEIEKAKEEAAKAKEDAKRLKRGEIIEEEVVEEPVRIIYTREMGEAEALEEDIYAIPEEFLPPPPVLTKSEIAAAKKAEIEAEKAEEAAVKRAEQDSLRAVIMAQRSADSLVRAEERDKEMKKKAAEARAKEKLKNFKKEGKRVKIAGSFVYDWTDSIRFINNHGSFLAQIRISIEDYGRIVFNDTVDIAKGVSDPLKFFSYEIDGMSIKDSLNLGLIPLVKTTPIREAGEARINFAVNKTEINRADSASVAELDAIKSRLISLLNNPDAEVRGVSINGVASPEGGFALNNRLANKRSEYLLNQIKGAVPARQLREIKMNYSSRVESWAAVADSLEVFDSLGVAEAKQIREIVAKYPKSYDSQSVQIRKMKRYRSVIHSKILPKLRRVEYSIDYIIIRPRTFEEVQVIFAENDMDGLKKLYNDDRTLYQIDLYNLMLGSQHYDNYRDIVEMIVEIDPYFTIAVNELAVLMIKDGEFSSEILEPLFDVRTPRPIRYNQAIMLLRTSQIDRAYELIYRLPNEPDYEFIRMLVDAKYGDFKRGLEYFAEYGGLNEIILLLAAQKYKEAYIKMNLLPEEEENSKFYYIKATCAFRISEDPQTDVVQVLAMQNDAVTYAIKAIDMDPRMGDIMKVDSDITGLLPYIDLRRKEQEEAAAINGGGQ